jgi:PhzF family phenazine biosynthesis protein
MLPFRQVDVFSAEPLLGNPVAVVHDADGLSEEQMAAFARWTNLSETTFLLTPTDPRADYRLRIFTPGGELPFAGHPTLGSAHAWLEAGGAPTGAEIVQECGVGLVRLRRSPRLAFAAPPLRRSGPVAEGDLTRIAAGLQVTREDIVDAQWVDNGPGWVAVMLPDAAAVLGVVPDAAALGDLAVGVVGVYPEGDCAVEVRAFVGGLGIAEDPVTGSLNAGLAQWLAGRTLPAAYIASQGTALRRRGRVHIETAEDGTIWVGGETRTTIVGTLGV